MKFWQLIGPRLFCCAAWALLAAACGPGAELSGSSERGSTDGAHVIALSTYDASIGTLIEVYGTRFPAPNSGRTNLLFEGVFAASDGTREPVTLEAPMRRIDGGTARWTSFGPFRNPFSLAGNRVGRFEGTVAARVITNDGEMLEDQETTPIVFDVKPSVLVHELQPLTASCNGAVLRGLGGAAYRMRVEAVGFDPLSFTYTLSAPGLDVSPVSVRHLAGGRFDSVGEMGDFRLPEVPSYVPSYGAIVSVQARDSGGKVYQNVFALSVHRPIEVYYNGNIEVAEVMAPTPVSGCIPGGINGREVEYGEAQTETRSRSYALNWNESWLNTHTVSSGSQNTIGLSETNGVGFSTTDGQSFNWSLGTEVGGTFGLSQLVELGVKANAERGGERSRSQTESRSRETGVNASSTTTETEEYSGSAGGEQGESFAWDVSSSETISRGFGGHVIAGTFGVFYRQTLRMMRRAAVVAYNQCGFANVVGDVDFVDWTWSPDLAMGNSCPPLPDSNLPGAQCYVPPCSGDQ